jgi:hypothetical protein
MSTSYRPEDPLFASQWHFGMIGRLGFDASVTAVRIFGGADDISNQWSDELLSLDCLRNFAVTNRSYGGFPGFYVSGDVVKFQVAAEQGRGGAGPHRQRSRLLQLWRACAGVSARRIRYHHLLGLGNGYDGLANGDYTNDFGGTSAAGLVTAGVVALMYDANSALGWRDVQNILASCATGTGSLYSGDTCNENFAWKWNGMVNAFNAVRMA